MEKKNKMGKRKELIRIVVLLSFVIFSLTVVSAGTYSGLTNTYTSSPSFQTYYGSSVGTGLGTGIETYWPAVADQQFCENRQDIIVQVPVGGCQPNVVRSDLLASQNVPVFCEVDALKLNPLIDIKEISNVAFEGTYPKDVVGVGFHPAMAAVRSYDRLLGSPVMSNIGYAVIVLKQNKNESSLPKNIRVNLTAQIQYDASNVIGTGKVEYLLNTQSDSEWQDAKDQQTFWNGRYSLRLRDADDNSASIAVYKGDNVIATTKVNKNDVSKDIYLPGSFCSAGLQVAYDGLVMYPAKARIEVTGDDGTDSYDIYPDSLFINGACKVQKLSMNDYDKTGFVDISCSGNKFRLSLDPKLLSVGDIIPANPSNGPIQIGYLDVQSKKVIFQNIKEAIVGKTQVCEVHLTSKNIPGDAGYYSLRRNDNSQAWQLFYRKDMTFIGDSKENELDRTGNAWLKNLKNELVTKCDIVNTDKKGTISETIYDGDTERYVQDALRTYQQVADDYPAEKEKTIDNSIANPTYGETALRAAINFAKNANKYETAGILMDKFLQLYPNSDYADSYRAEKAKLFNVDNTNAMKLVKINQKQYMIRVIGFDSPQSGDSKIGADLTVGRDKFKLAPGELHYFQTQQGDQAFEMPFLYDENSVWIKPYCSKDVDKILGSLANQLTAKEKISEMARRARDWALDPTAFGAILRVGETKQICGESVTLNDINLVKAAKVRLIPKGLGVTGKTNLTVGIGIEKRAIQLSPDKTRDLVNSLNKTIARWESISNKLGGVVEGLKGACLATSAALTVKNFVTGFSGGALARQQVMRGTGGWTEKCQNESSMTGKSLSQCYSDHASEIESDVNAYKQKIQKTNDKIKEIENGCKTDSGKSSILSFLDSGPTIDREKCSKSLAEAIKNDCGNVNVKVNDGTAKGITVSVDSLLAGDGSREIGYTQLRDMYSDCLVVNNKVSASSTMVAKANTELTGFGDSIYRGKQRDNLIDGVGDKIKSNSIYANMRNKNMDYVSTNIHAVVGNYYGGKMKASDLPGYPIKLPNDAIGPSLPGAVDADTLVPTAFVSVDQTMYLVTLQKTSGGDQYGITDVYGIDDGDARPQNIIDTKIKDKIKGQFSYFRLVDASSYNNKYDSPEVQYYETDPYKGLPALVPSDVDHGWYAATKQTVSALGGIKAYDSSGRPVSFWVCNVGKNHRAEFFNGMGDDICTQFNVDTGQSMTEMVGLSKTESDKIVKGAVQALKDATQNYGKTGYVLINGEKINVGKPASGAPGQECQDFMSPSDCKILFNVCDPVICPASRCNFGGKYPVADVIQTGIVGSALLCLPNYKEVYMPVCLSGIKAGLDAYTSVLKAHRDCLQNSLSTGQMTGICDEIYSIYMCEFFWGQIAPVAGAILPKILENAYSGGSNVRGGGEYATVTGAWQNAQQSVNYLTQVYGTNAFKAFQARNLENIGSDVCKGFISANIPTAFKTFIQPDSPPQFYARFDSAVINTATVPATAEYKIFYHIFGGKDSGVYYSVYLKNPPQSSYYSMNDRILIASGYIVKGQYADETKTLTLPDGYKELCVNINGEDKCGFKQVSTDLLVNELKDIYVSDQLTQTNIKSDSECVGGTPGLGTVLGTGPNLQSTAETAISPQIYKNGIIRVCATDNPGGKYSTRYVEQGHCDDLKVKCWLDILSVNRSISAENIGLKNEMFSEIKSNQAKILGEQGVFVDESSGNAAISIIEGKIAALKAIFDRITGKPTDSQLMGAANLLDDIQNISERMYFNYQKAKILFKRGQTQEIIAGPFVKVAKASLASQNVLVPVTRPIGGVPSESLEYLRIVDSSGANDYYGLHWDSQNNKLMIKMVVYDSIWYKLGARNVYRIDWSDYESLVSNPDYQTARDGATLSGSGMNSYMVNLIDELFDKDKNPNWDAVKNTVSIYQKTSGFSTEKILQSQMYPQFPEDRNPLTENPEFKLDLNADEVYDTSKQIYIVYTKDDKSTKVYLKDGFVWYDTTNQELIKNKLNKFGQVSFGKGGFRNTYFITLSKESIAGVDSHVLKTINGYQIYNANTKGKIKYIGPYVLSGSSVS